MRLGYLNDPHIVNSIYRCAIPMQALEEQGHTVLRPQSDTQDVALGQLASCDLVHCFRRRDRIPDLMSLAQRGVAISFDNDDNLAASDMVAGNSSLRGLRQNRKASASFTKLARVADLVTTPSELLADHYRAAGAQNVVVIENYLQGHMPHFGFGSRHEGVVVGWIAALEHAADVLQLKLVEVMSRLLDTHSNLRVLTVGVQLPIRSDRYEYIKQVPYEELLKATARIDIGIAPLVDNPFNRARSNVKIKEYGAGGAAWLASPVGPYLALGSSQGGELVANEHWFESIDGLVRSGIRRRRLARRALRWAKTQTIDRNRAIWESQFLLAIERAEARSADGAVAVRQGQARS